MPTGRFVRVALLAVVQQGHDDVVDDRLGTAGWESSIGEETEHDEFRAEYGRSGLGCSCRDFAPGSGLTQRFSQFVGSIAEAPIVRQGVSAMFALVGRCCRSRGRGSV